MKSYSFMVVGRKTGRQSWLIACWLGRQVLLSVEKCTVLVYILAAFVKNQLVIRAYLAHTGLMVVIIKLIWLYLKSMLEIERLLPDMILHVIHLIIKLYNHTIQFMLQLVTISKM